MGVVWEDLQVDVMGGMDFKVSYWVINGEVGRV